jgi:hypothetical protein
MTLPSLHKTIDERSSHEENEFPDEKVGVGHRSILNGPLNKKHD